MISLIALLREIGPPFVALVLTLMVFSYILGDNVLFKLATHIFVGVAVGYAIIAVVHGVFGPIVLAVRTASPAEAGLVIARVLPALVLCLLLIPKTWPSQIKLFNVLGSIVLAFVLGVGVALAIGGALFGTLLPQVSALASISFRPDPSAPADSDAWQVTMLNNIIIILGSLGTLFYFTFAVRGRSLVGGLREIGVRFLAGMGRLMIIFTLGALFANTVSSRLALLIARLQFLIDTSDTLIKTLITWLSQK